MYDTINSSKAAAARRYGLTWRAVNQACIRVAEEALGRVDLLDGLCLIAIDEVKFKKGNRYLTVVCDHATGLVVWATEGRSQGTVESFFDALGPDRTAALRYMSADGADWIRSVVERRAPEATVCMDPFHTMSWAVEGLNEVRRAEWNRLRAANHASGAKAIKGLRVLLGRNWGNLTRTQRGVIWDIKHSNDRLFRAWQLKEELAELLRMPLWRARIAISDWIYYARRSRLKPFVRLAATIKNYRASIEATIEAGLTNGIAEANNAHIGRLRLNARGFHTPQALITMIYLDRAGIKPQLPWAPNPRNRQ